MHRRAAGGAAARLECRSISQGGGSESEVSTELWGREKLHNGADGGGESSSGGNNAREINSAATRRTGGRWRGRGGLGELGVGRDQPLKQRRRR